jgi:thiazole synthase
MTKVYRKMLRTDEAEWSTLREELELAQAYFFLQQVRFGTLVDEGFKVMVYCTDDPIQCRMLEDLGAVAVMPLASLIGSGMGILNPWNLRLIIDQARVPIVVDAGVGTASDAAIAMELGCDAVLMNTAIAGARDPILMASAMKKGVEAGREAFLAGRMPKKLYSGAPSSPTEGLITAGAPK